MEIVLRDGESELLVDHQAGCISFTVITADGDQIDFSVDISEWGQLKSFIDYSISMYITGNYPQSINKSPEGS